MMSENDELEGCEASEDDIVVEDTDVNMLVLFPTSDESTERDWKELFPS